MRTPQSRDDVIQHQLDRLFSHPEKMRHDGTQFLLFLIFCSIDHTTCYQIVCSTYLSWIFQPKWTSQRISAVIVGKALIIYLLPRTGSHQIKTTKKKIICSSTFWNQVVGKKIYLRQNAHSWKILQHPVATQRQHHFKGHWSSSCNCHGVKDLLMLVENHPRARSRPKWMVCGSRCQSHNFLTRSVGMNIWSKCTR
jgi:hypothetical protein